jgi:zinc transport system substrate-binding protein
MKKIGIILLVLFIFGIFLTKENRKPAGELPSTKAVATIFPLYDIVRNIAGNEVKTELLLKPGASPHTYDPSPKDIEMLSQSQALFAIGHGLDDWVVKLAEAEKINTVIVDNNIDLIKTDEKDEGAGTKIEQDNTGEEKEIHEHEGVDPHYWLSIPNAMKIAEQVKTELSSLFPEKAFLFEKNYKDYQTLLTDLNNQINSRINQLTNKNIATFHSAWGYFARDHGLYIVTTFEEFPGEEPSPKYLKEFQEKVVQQNIKVIFSEPQFSSAPLSPIAADLGVKLGILDPLGGVEGRNSYFELLQFNLEQIEINTK